MCRTLQQRPALAPKSDRRSDSVQAVGQHAPGHRRLLAAAQHVKAIGSRSSEAASSSAQRNWAGRAGVVDDQRSARAALCPRGVTRALPSPCHRRARCRSPRCAGFAQVHARLQVESPLAASRDNDGNRQRRPGLWHSRMNGCRGRHADSSTGDSGHRSCTSKPASHARSGRCRAPPRCPSGRCWRQITTSGANALANGGFGATAGAGSCDVAHRPRPLRAVEGVGSQRWMIRRSSPRRRPGLGCAGARNAPTIC